MPRPILTAILALAVATPAAAQVPDSAQRGGCFRGHAPATCRSFWITEAAYGIRLSPAGGSFLDGGRVLPTVELGGMQNVSSRIAVGATVGAGRMDDFYLTAKPRIRFWLAPGTSLDLAPGLRLAGRMGYSRFTADASLMFADRIGVTAQTFSMQSITYDAGGQLITRNHLKAYLGLRLGSTLGIGGAVADAAALVVALGAFLVACGGGACYRGGAGDRRVPSAQAQPGTFPARLTLPSSPSLHS